MRVLKGKAWFERRYFLLHQQIFEAVWCFRRSTGTFEGKRGVFWRERHLFQRVGPVAKVVGGGLKFDKKDNIFKPKFWKKVSFFGKNDNIFKPKFWKKVSFFGKNSYFLQPNFAQLSEFFIILVSKRSWFFYNCLNFYLRVRFLALKYCWFWEGKEIQLYINRCETT